MLLWTADEFPVPPSSPCDCARAGLSDNPALAELISKMFRRDMRKRASDLAEDVEEASGLLQHGNTRTTERHYRAGWSSCARCAQNRFRKTRLSNERKNRFFGIFAEQIGLQAAPDADFATDSKSRGVKPVPVRFRPPAPKHAIETVACSASRSASVPQKPHEAR